MSDTDEPRKEHAIPLPGGHILRCEKEGDNLRPTAIGRLTPLEDGVTVTGDLVEITKHPDTLVMDLKVLVKSPFGRTKGPARVPNRAYRDGWDRIFSEPSEEVVDSLMNQVSKGGGDGVLN
jgi:hypothetical protein